MKAFSSALILLIVSSAPMFARAKLQGYCEKGGQVVVTAGTSSTTKVQASYPSCTVTVFDAGTANLSSIFEDNAGTVKANPFTASSTGLWFFYADNGRYDVRMSGTVNPAFTLGDLTLTDVTGALAAPTGVTVGNGTTLSGVVAASQLQQLHRKPNVTATSYEFTAPAHNRASDYSFPAQTPAAALTAGVDATITFTPCPLGLNWNNPAGSNSLYITDAVAGNEPVTLKATGPGTCTSGAATGTVTITAIDSNHADGDWSIGSSSGGIQDAICALPASGGEVVISEGVALYANVGACGKTDVKVTKAAGATVTGAFTVLGSSLVAVVGSASVSNTAAPAAMVSGPTGLVDIRSFGAVCDGSDSNASVQSAITAGAKQVFIPAGCHWIPPASTIPSGLHVICEDPATSVIKSAANPATTTLRIGSYSSAQNCNLRGNTCNTPTDCPVTYLVNVSTETQNIVTTGYSSFDSISGDPATDTTGVFFKVGSFVTPGIGPADALNVSNAPGPGHTGNGLRADNYANAPGVSAILATAMPGAADASAVIQLTNNTGAHAPPAGVDWDLNPIFINMYDIYRESGAMFQVNHTTSDYTGNVIEFELAQGSGSFTGNFESYRNNGVEVFRVDSDGDLLSRTLTSDVATGTAPLVVASTTPVANLTGQVLAYNAAGAQQVGAHTVFGTCTLGTDCAVTLVGAAAFTSGSSYVCTGTDQTSAAAVKVVNTANNVVTFTGTGTDVIAYQCVGN